MKNCCAMPTSHWQCPDFETTVGQLALIYISHNVRNRPLCARYSRGAKNSPARYTCIYQHVRVQYRCIPFCRISEDCATCNTRKCYATNPTFEEIKCPPKRKSGILTRLN